MTTGIDSRSSQSLDGRWTIALDPENRGRTEEWFSGIPAVETRQAPVPGTIQQVFPASHGVAWYWRTIHQEGVAPNGARALLRFSAADYLSDVWLNGAYLGGHEGGETPFTLDATSALQSGDNLLAVRVLNPTDTPVDSIVLDQTPHRNKRLEGDFQPGSGKNYGGIVQTVELLVVPPLYISDILVRPHVQSGEVDVRVALQSARPVPTRVTLSIAVGPAREGTVLACTTHEVEVPAGVSSHEAALSVPRPHLWSLDDPFLYRLTVVAQVSDATEAASRDEVSRRCGFRDFRVVDGYFQLNGKRLWLRSTHTGDHFPVGYYAPADPDLIRRDLLYAKAVGLNTVRFIAGMALTEQLDVCDEIGLLVYEENLAAWLLGDSPQMAERFDRSLREMVLRDRNHPSVVIWGLLNETHDGPVFRHAVQSLPLLRELDPDRLVLLSSGRWDGDLAIGSVCNPGGMGWEPEWGREGEATGEGWESSEEHKEPAYVPGAGDVHIYPQVPQSDETNAFLRSLGHDSKPVFVSEYGIGSLLDVVHIVERYRQVKDTPAADDLIVFETMRTRLEEDWARFGMDAVYAFPRDLLRESQRLHSRLRLLGLNLLRSNPKVAGYNLTGMLDHGYTGEGMWTFWREWKPGIVEALEDGFAPLRWCLFAQPEHVYAGRTVLVEAVLANEDVLPPGDYAARLRVFGPAGRAWQHEMSVHLVTTPTSAGNPLAVPVFKQEVTIAGPAGVYVLAAHLLEGGSPAGDRIEFYVSDPAALPDVRTKATLWGVDERTAAWLTHHGVQCRRFGAQVPDEREVVVVGDLSSLAPADVEAGWLALAAQMARGSVALILSPGALRRGEDPVGWLPLATKGCCRRFNNWLYHREDVAKPHPIFSGLRGPGIMDWTYYGPVIPHYVFEGQETPDDIAVVFFATGHAPTEDKTGYAAGLISASYPFGAGRFFLSSLRVLENVDRHPAADRLLLNMIANAATLAQGPAAPLPDHFDALLQSVGFGTRGSGTPSPGA